MLGRMTTDAVAPRKLSNIEFVTAIYNRNRHAVSLFVRNRIERGEEREDMGYAILDALALVELLRHEDKEVCMGAHLLVSQGAPPDWTYGDVDLKDTRDYDDVVERAREVGQLGVQMTSMLSEEERAAIIASLPPRRFGA